MAVRRKIQLIAGTTYSISLPKDWVKLNKLKEGNEILISDRSDKSLIITPHELNEPKLNEISISVDDHASSIEESIHAAYYLGVETINLYSKKEISKESRSRILKALQDMHGTVVTHENEKKISIRVLIDRLKIDIYQTLFRISLLLKLSLSNLIQSPDIKEIRINEGEIDKLYHLTIKIITMSLVDSNILESSKIKNPILIPSFFLMSKRLENMGDNILHYMEERQSSVKKEHLEVLDFVRAELDRSTKHLMSNFPRMFDLPDEKVLRAIYSKTDKKEDLSSREFLHDLVRYIMDIEKEIAILSFHLKMGHEGNI